MVQEEHEGLSDSVAAALSRYAQNILVVIFGLIPLLFIPQAAAPFEYTKIFIVVVGVLVALVLLSLSTLRAGVVRLTPSYTLYALWAVAAVAFISSLLSGDFKDSLVGDFFSVHSTIFVVILAFIPTVWMLVRVSKASIMRLYILLSVSTLVLVVFHILRLVFGADSLSLGIFTTNTSTPVGSWNDLALFLGLTIILSLVTLEQLALTRVGRMLFSLVVVVSLLMLGVINFFMVWLIIGLTSLVMVVYSLGKDKFSRSQPSLMSEPRTQTASLWVSLLVLAVSILFIIGGSTLGGWINTYTNVTYIEVRPSLEATADIARNVYRENAFLGIGTNKFTDAWRLYKDSSINVTPFWNTDFNAGNGYITSFFVTTGVLGGVAWFIFLLVFAITGFRRLLTSSGGDKMWYFIAVSSFVGAVYIWGMSVIYVPGVVILLLGALCTGVSLSAMSILEGSNERVIAVGANRRTGFMFTLVVIAVIIGSVSFLYTAGRHYASVYTFNKSLLAMQASATVDELELQVASANEFSSSDVFARRIAEYQLARMNMLLGLAEPTVEEQQQFQRATEIGINAAQLATDLDSLEPLNWSVRGNIYSLLASVNVEGAQGPAIESLTRARELNPRNPLPYVELAIVEARAGNYEVARGYLNEAIALKPNFTDAYFVLSQLEIATGNVDAAIDSIRATINLEPQNPIRYYQLGVLLSSRNTLAEAIPAFEQAIALDPNYANARYLLALAYDGVGRSADAKRELETVLTLNPGNTEVTELIDTINKTGSLASIREEANRTINEPEPTTEENGTVSTTEESENPLLTPVNTAPSDNNENDEIQ